MAGKKLAHWVTIGSQEVFVAEPWIKISRQQVYLPNTETVDDYYRIEMPECAVVFAQTTEGKVIVERQYRHGVGEVTLMLPAGFIEEGESPLSGARRELLEETGYRSDDWRALGKFVINANYGCGKAHLFLAKNSELIAEPRSGDLEETDILLMTPEALINAVYSEGVASLAVATAVALATHPSRSDTETVV